MSEPVICAIITLCGSIASIAASMALVNWRLQQLEKKVDEHNSWGDKFSRQATDIALISQDVSYIKKTIERLEKTS